jgi:hypothetical protein
MSPGEFKNLIIESAWLFPGHGMAGVMHNSPLAVLHVSAPDAHQGWWR